MPSSYFLLTRGEKEAIMSELCAQCGMLTGTIKITVDGLTIYSFCSETCREMFEFHNDIAECGRCGKVVSSQYWGIFNNKILCVKCQSPQYKISLS